MTTKFTDEQIKAACVAYEYTNAFGPERETRMRAALEAAAAVAPQSLSVERVMDALAYYYCRAVNPKADSPIQGYHAMSEDQREFLRERQREGAAEVMRIFSAPTQPSRPIDEGELAEVIRASRVGKMVNEDGTTSIGFASSPDIARAVIAHLEGKAGGGDGR